MFKKLHKASPQHCSYRVVSIQLAKIVHPTLFMPSKNEFRLGEKFDEVNKVVKFFEINLYRDDIYITVKKCIQNINIHQQLCLVDFLVYF